VGKPVANEEIRLKNIDLALQTTMTLFLRYGIENTTREMIARESGLSRKSLERYFTGKADCVVQTAEWMGRCLRHEVRAFSSDLFVDGRHTAADILEMYLEDLGKLLFGEPRIFICFVEFKAFIYRNSENSQRDYKRFLDAVGYRRLFQRIFALGVQDGTVATNSDLESESRYLANTLISFFSSVALYNIGSEQMKRYIDQYITDTMHLYCGEPKHAIHALK
jgi:AcrR family transcriptional regulator